MTRGKKPRRRKVVSRKKSRKPVTKKRDIVARLRAVIWYEIVKAITGLSDDELDERYLHVPAYRQSDDDEEPGRTRAFRAVGYYGANPDLVSKRGISLVDSCRQRNKKLVAASEVFHSLFWKLCSYPRPDLAQVEAIIYELLAKRHLWRPDYRQVIAMQIRGVEKAGIEPGLTERFKKSVADSIPLDHIDGLALSSAMYIEAMAHMELEQAVFMKKYVLRALQLFLARWNFRPDTARSLELLVTNRVLGNRWTYPDLKTKIAEVRGIRSYMPGDIPYDPEKIRVASVSKSIPAFIAFRAFASSEMTSSIALDSHRYPLMKLTEELMEIIENTEDILDEESNKYLPKDYWDPYPPD